MLCSIIQGGVQQMSLTTCADFAPDRNPNLQNQSHLGALMFLLKLIKVLPVEGDLISAPYCIIASSGGSVGRGHS